ncbi:hypothetical protein ACJJTC_018091 [Scirpophaga incertulas]
MRDYSRGRGRGAATSSAGCATRTRSWTTWPARYRQVKCAGPLPSAPTAACVTTAGQMRRQRQVNDAPDRHTLVSTSGEFEAAAGDAAGAAAQGGAPGGRRQGRRDGGDACQRCKKLKMLESQLESEHSERSLLLRERHELERRLAALEETARAENHEQAQLVQRLKRDLKRYRALLRDAQTMLEQKEKEGGAKAQIRQLKNQVEDLELAVRAAELLKKYRTSANALCAAQAEAREASERAEVAMEETRATKERLAEVTARLAQAEAGHTLGHTEAERRLDMRNKELESSLELEATARGRLEGQLSRLREAHEQLAGELAAAKARDAHAADELRKLTRHLRELKEENSELHAKLSECSRAKAAAEGLAAAAGAEAAAARDEARLAARRATALQQALAGDLASPAHSRDSDSDNESYSSDESIGTFLANHKLSPTAPSRTSLHLDSHKSQTPEGRQSRSSASSGSKPLSPSKEAGA